MWVFDRETLSFLEVNDAAIQLYGYRRDEFLRMRITQIRPPEDVARLLRGDYLKDAATAAKWRHCTKTGSVIPVSITSWPFEFHGHKAELVLARWEM